MKEPQEIDGRHLVKLNPMMSLSDNEIRAMHAEIQQVSTTKKLLARPALQAMLDLINPTFSISPLDYLRQYLARVTAAEGLVKVLYSIFIIRSSASFYWNMF